MKQVSVDNLKENDILAFPILSHSGTVLIHADVALTDELIERAINLGVRTVYIKDEKEGIVRENTSDSDTAREEEEYPYRLEETANNSRQIVKKILEKHIYKHNEELKIIVNEAQRILDTVIAEPEVVNNITEIRNVSTDMYTHCINVCTLSTIMALRLKMSNKQIHNIAMGAILHDIGLRYINVPYVNVSENKMAIIDADMHMNQPKGLTAASGIDALTHALEAYASIMATEYTDGLALQAMKNIFEYLPAAYELGAHDAVAREKMATASTMAGMAFANAFLGVCHSLAHKLGAYHHLPHGIANALLITDVMRFNAAEIPTKMGTFSQYQYPHCKARYVECADFLGIQGKDDDEKFENLIKAIEELKAKVGIKKTIADYGVKEEDFLATLDEMTEAAFDDQCTGANPRYPLMSEMKAMYLKAYYGK